VNGDTVRVWLFRSDQPDTVLADLFNVLDDDERGRAQAMTRDDDRRRFVVAHGATRVIIGRRLGAPADQIRWQRGPHGKPELCGRWTGVQVNLSHSGDLNVLAVTDRRRVGVDVQKLLPDLDPVAMAARFFPPMEARFVAAAGDGDGRADRFGRLWTRKEACLKACGGTLAQGLALPVQGSGDIIVSHPGGALPGPFVVRDVAVPAGFRASVALEGTGGYRLVCRWWHS
jgi:4'-phosphopantetheinyl transferase